MAHEETGVDDVRRVREAIARQHKGNLAEHISESNRIARGIGKRIRLGRTVQPPRGGNTKENSR